MHYHYFLNVEDCLNFNVFDAYSGKIRHVSTLSGGETFAASLALCLGLCGLVSNMFGGIEFNTMLIDEGFGSLDENYLNSDAKSYLSEEQSRSLVSEKTGSGDSSGKLKVTYESVSYKNDCVVFSKLSAGTDAYPDLAVLETLTIPVISAKTEN